MLLSYHLRSQWNKVEVLSQAMDILDALRKRQALPSDEVLYLIYQIVFIVMVVGLLQGFDGAVCTHGSTSSCC